MHRNLPSRRDNSNEALLFLRKRHHYFCNHLLTGKPMSSVSGTWVRFQTESNCLNKRICKSQNPLRPSARVLLSVAYFHMQGKSPQFSITTWSRVRKGSFVLVLARLLCPVGVLMITAARPCIDLGCLGKAARGIERLSAQ